MQYVHRCESYYCLSSRFYCFDDDDDDDDDENEDNDMTYWDAQYC